MENVENTLQWGRARAGAEWPPCMSNCHTQLASMGPRPRGRGMLSDKVIRGRHSEASMGPRPRGRGMRWQSYNIVIHRLASMGPRPRGRGMSYYLLTKVTH